MKLKPTVAILTLLATFATFCWIGHRDLEAGRHFTYLCQNAQGQSPLEACR